MITIRTCKFSCPWDSGQVGWIYCSKEKVTKEYGEWSAETIAKCEEALRQEVKTYDEYLTGKVYGYIVKDSEGDEFDSCWGFFGLDYCIEEATAAAKCMAKHKQKIDTDACCNI